MRKSLQDIKHMVRDIPYPQPLPPEIEPYHVYLADAGHSILCVLEMHLEEANGEMDRYELPVPVKYVRERGYRIQDGYIIVEANYDPFWGLDVGEGYDEH